MFKFRGPVLASKSWLNRALVIQHFFPKIKIDAVSQSEDVVCLSKAIQSIGSVNEFDLGMGGTSFRFFAILISRHSGIWKIKAHQRLLERPQQEIINLLHQLGVKAEFNKNELLINSQGWKEVQRIHCSAQVSTQFASGLLLSCWGLKSAIEIVVEKPINSLGYLKLSIELLRSAGMNIQVIENDKTITCIIPENQRTNVDYLEPELDISSAFSLVSAAVVSGRVEITNWKNNSAQPDIEFLKFFNIMKIKYEIKNNIFSIEKHNIWNSIDCNLSNSPDLFPVLAVLCAFAEGISTLTGGAQLKYKESDRIKKTKELLDLINIQSEFLPDGLKIYGRSSSQSLNSLIQFDPDLDHRMAMAAALLKLKAYNIQIANPEVVKKSFPSFWSDVGLTT